MSHCQIVVTVRYCQTVHFDIRVRQGSHRLSCHQSPTLARSWHSDQSTHRSFGAKYRPGEQLKLTRRNGIDTVVLGYDSILFCKPCQVPSSRVPRGLCPSAEGSWGSSQRKKIKMPNNNGSAKNAMHYAKQNRKCKELHNMQQISR